MREAVDSILPNTAAQAETKMGKHSKNSRPDTSRLATPSEVYREGRATNALNAREWYGFNDIIGRGA